VQSVAKDHLILADENCLKVGMTVWAAGLAPNPFITQTLLTFEKNLFDCLTHKDTF
jgi:NADH dehydrogenase FAD-containing subunit